MIAQTHTLQTFIVSNYLTECILLHTSVLFQRFSLAFISIHNNIIIPCPLRQATFLKHANYVMARLANDDVKAYDVTQSLGHTATIFRPDRPRLKKSR